MNEEKKIEETPFILYHILPDSWSDTEREAHPITAEKIINAIKNRKRIIIINAVIKGLFILHSETVESEIIILGTKIKGHLDWSYADFKQVLNLQKSTFETNAIFTGAKVDKDILLDNVTFHENVQFLDLTVAGVFYCRSAKFKKEAIFVDATFSKRVEFNKSIFDGVVNFNGAIIGGAAVFFETEFKQKATFTGSMFKDFALFSSANFEEEAEFGQMQIASYAFFKDSKFKQNANFNGVQIEGHANLIGVEFKKEVDFSASNIEKGVLFNSAIFEGEVNFKHVCIGNFADFIGAKFHHKASFNGSSIKGRFLFREAIFEHEVDFGQAWIGSTAEFDKVEFNQDVSFNIVQIEKTALFTSITFGGNADFICARFGGAGANFEGTKFGKKADFTGSHIEGVALFNKSIFEGEVEFAKVSIGSLAQFTGANFKKKVNFKFAQINGDIDFKETIFSSDVNFQYTSFRTINFAKSDNQFHGKIDLRGCTYDFINPISIWEQLMEHRNTYDRQPFTQLEETLRRAGKDNLADDVYFKGRYKEFIENAKFSDNDIRIRNPYAMIKRSLWLLKDMFLRFLTGYGVQVIRLLPIIIIILIVGTVIFHQPGAVVLKSDINQTLVLPQDSYWEAFFVSLNLFLPIEIPSGAYWKLSQDFVIFGTLWKLAGWILILLGLQVYLVYYNESRKFNE